MLKEQQESIQFPGWELGGEITYTGDVSLLSEKWISALRLAALLQVITVRIKE